MIELSSNRALEAKASARLDPFTPGHGRCKLGGAGAKLPGDPASRPRRQGGHDLCRRVAPPADRSGSERGFRHRFRRQDSRHLRRAGARALHRGGVRAAQLPRARSPDRTRPRRRRVADRATWRSAVSVGVQPNVKPSRCGLRRRNRPAIPSPARPASIIAHVDGSGIAAAVK
jgi:hypothetical protein